MPVIEPDTIVNMDAGAVQALRYPPPSLELIVAVEDAALKSHLSTLTTAITFAGGGSKDITWVGSIDEAMVSVSNSKASGGETRRLLSRMVLTGNRLFEVIRPGALRHAGDSTCDTVYQGDRPWVIIGEISSGGVLAAPLNDPGVRRRGHYQHAISAAHLNHPGAKDSLLELNHPWSFPSSLPSVGRVACAAHPDLRAALDGYYPGRKRKEGNA